MAAPRKLVDELTSTVREALSAEATRRSTSDLAKLSDHERKALAMSVLADELKRIDQRQIATNRTRLSKPDESDLIAEVIAATCGLGANIELLLADPTVEDIVFSRYDCGFTYHSDGSCRRVDARWPSDAALREWLSFLANTKGGTGRSFNAQQPLLVLQIGDGLRLAASCEVSEHTTFALRRNTMGRVELGGLARLGMFPDHVAQLLRALIRAPEMRVVVVGATAAGKTTLVRAMLNELDPYVRVGIVEDTREIGLRDESHPNVESFEVREANSQGEGAVAMEDLVAQLFRYRVDKLIVGEVRSAAAAVPMLHAMTNGMSSLTTTHEHTARGGLEKLAEMLAQGTAATAGMELGLAKVQVARAVDIAIHVDRGRGGRRFISEIVEVSGHEGDQILTQQLYAADWTGTETAFNRVSSRLVADKLRRAGFDDARVVA